MTRTLCLDGVDHDVASLSDAGRKKLAMVDFVDRRIAELTNMQALLTRARRSYMNGLEREIVTARSGIDFATLLSD